MKGLSSRGIYTLLDMHQDVLWKSGVDDDESGYWGVPPWIKHRFSKCDKEFPWPLEEIQAWPCGYFTKEISRGWFNSERKKFRGFGFEICYEGDFDSRLVWLIYNISLKY